LDVKRRRPPTVASIVDGEDLAKRRKDEDSESMDTEEEARHEKRNKGKRTASQSNNIPMNKRTKK